MLKRESRRRDSCRCRRVGAAGATAGTLGGGDFPDMFRFLVGTAIGGALTWWYLTGEVPFSEDATAWLSKTASGYTSGSHDADQEADLIRPRGR